MFSLADSEHGFLQELTGFPLLPLDATRTSHGCLWIKVRVSISLTSLFKPSIDQFGSSIFITYNHSFITY